MEIVGQLLLAVLWGGLVGVEREYRSKSAGFRTMILISLGSCLFTFLSGWVGGPNNTDRIAANIVTGIGFLGAGAIFRDENRVNGITTAATIWAVAAVGMAIGAGRYTAAGFTSILVIIVLAVLPFFERQIEGLNQYKKYTISCDYSENMRERYEDLLTQYGLHFKLINQTKEGNRLSFTWQAQGDARQHDEFINVIMQDIAAKKFTY